jgi:hypothetical protein
MGTLEIILVLIWLTFLILGFLVLFSKLQNTRWYRLKKASKFAHDKKKQELELLEKYSRDIPDHEKDKFIHKLNRGEKIKMDLPTYHHMVTHYDDGEVGVIDKNGQIVVLKLEAYQKLKAANQSNKKIENTNKKVISAEKNYMQIQHQKDGTVTEKNLISNVLKITKPNGDITVTDHKTVVTYKSKEEDADKKHKGGSKKDGKGKSNTQHQNNNQSASTSSKSIESQNFSKMNEELNGLLEDEFDSREENEDEIIEAEVEIIVKKEEVEKVEEEIIEVIPEEETNEKEQDEQLEFNRFTLPSFENFEDFITQLDENSMLDFLYSIIINTNNIDYPVVFIDERNLFIDSSYFALCFIESFSDEESVDNFISEYFLGSKNYRVDLKASVKLISHLNDIAFQSSMVQLFNIWKNEKMQDLFISNKTIESDGNKYLSSTISIDITAINNLNIDLSNISEIEIIEKDKTALNLSELLFEKFIVKG